MTRKIHIGVRCLSIAWLVSCISLMQQPEAAYAKAQPVEHEHMGLNVLHYNFELGVWGGKPMGWSNQSNYTGNNAAEIRADGDLKSVRSEASSMIQVQNTGFVAFSAWTHVVKLEQGEAQVRVNFFDSYGKPILAQGKNYGYSVPLCRIQAPEAEWTLHQLVLLKDDWPVGTHQVSLKAYWEAARDNPTAAPKGMYFLDDVTAFVPLPVEETPRSAEDIKAAMRGFYTERDARKTAMRELWKAGLWRQAPMEEAKCPETGQAYFRITRGEGNSHHIYFNRPNFSAESRYLFFLSDRTGTWEVYAHDLKEERCVRLTDDDLDQFCRPAVSQTCTSVYFVTPAGDVVELDYLSGERKTLFVHSIPPTGDFLLMDLSANGEYLGFLEISHVDRGEDIQALFVNLFMQKPMCAFWIYSIPEDRLWKAHEEPRSLQHLLFNPVNPELLLYCHEGPWHRVAQRLWLMDWHGNNNRPIRIEEEPAIGIGHEYWMSDGKHIAYSFRGTGPDESPTVRKVNIDTGVETVLASERFAHFISDPSGNLIVGDDPDWVKTLDLKTGTVRAILRHGQELTVRNTHYHPHPAFSPDGEMIVFCTRNHGSNDVAIVRMAETAD